MEDWDQYDGDMDDDEDLDDDGDYGDGDEED